MQLNKLFEKFLWQKASAKNREKQQHLNPEYMPIVKFQNQHQLIDVGFDWDDIIYQSIFLGIDHDKGLLTLDELFPDPNISADLVGQTINIQSRDPATFLHFRAEVIEHNAGGAVHTLVVRLPEHVVSEQRRNNFRLSVANLTHSLASLDIDNTSHFDGTVMNVSNTGCRIMLDGPLPEILHTQCKIPECHFELGDDVELDCGFEICNRVSAEQEKEHSFIGGRFANMKRTNEKALNQFIMKSERESRKGALARQHHNYR